MSQADKSMAPREWRLPQDWNCHSDGEVLHLSVPPRGGGVACTVSLIALISSGIAYLNQASPSWTLSFLSLGLIAAGVTAFSVANEQWRVEEDSLIIRYRLGFLRWTAGPYHFAALVARKNATDEWELRLRDSQGSERLLHQSPAAEDVILVGELLAGRTGWTFGSLERSPELLREVVRLALENRNAHRLRQLAASETALPVLAQMWRAAPAANRPNIWRTFETFTDPRQWLLRVLESSNQAARAAAIDLLGEHGDSAAAPALRTALGSPDAAVRTRAAAALGRLRDIASVPPLCRALEYGGDLPMVAAWALGEIGDPRAVPELLEVLRSGERAAEGDLRRTAAIALGRIGDESAVPALCEALRDPVIEVRESAAEALEMLASPLAVPALCAALAVPQDRVRLRVVAALERIRDERAVEALARCFDEASPVVRGKVLRALAAIGSEQGLPTLCRGLGDRKVDVRREAAEALRILAAGCDDASLRLRAAVPILERMCAGFSPERGDVKRACRLALRQIDQRTASVKDLPLPAEHGELSPANLPRSVDPAETIVLQQHP